MLKSSSSDVFTYEHIIKPDRHILKDYKAPIQKLVSISNQLKQKKEIRNIEYHNQGFDNRERFQTALEFLFDKESMDEVDLSNNDISDNSLLILHQSLTKITQTNPEFKIKKLKLKENKITCNCVQTIAELMLLVKIEDLDISMNPNMSSLNCIYITIPLLNSLKRLHLVNIPQKKQDLEKLGHMIKESKSLEMIDLSSNKWVSDYLDILTKSLIETKSITAVDFSNIYFAEKPFKIFCDALALPPHKRGALKLKSIYLRNCKISNRSFKNLSSAIESNKTLEKLDLSLTEVNQYFLLALSKNSTLKSLNISGNTLTQKSFALFLSSLHPNGQFSPEELSISCNCCTLATFQDLFTSLISNKKLLKLDISNSRITDCHKVKTIADYLSKNPNLTKLDLSGNKFYSHMSELLPVFSYNNNLKVLNLTCTGISDLKKLKEYFKNNFSLEKVYYSTNKVLEMVHPPLLKTDNSLLIRDTDSSKHFLFTGDIKSVAKTEEEILSFALDCKPKVSSFFLLFLFFIKLKTKQISKLESVTFFNAKLTEWMTVDTFQSLTNLTSLCLRKNSLWLIPPEVEHLKSLKKIDISDNNIGCIGYLSLIPSIEEIIANHNNIFVLMGTLGMLTNLKKMHLRNNTVDTLPVSLTKLSKLEELDLTENPMRMIPPYIIKPNDFFLKRNTNQMKHLFGYLSSLGIDEKDISVDNSCKLMFVGDGLFNSFVIFPSYMLKNII